MARKTAAEKKAEAEAAAAEEEATAPEPGERSQMEKHEAFVEWFEEEYEQDLSKMGPAEVIARFAAKRNEFRKSEGYLEQWGPEAREAAKAQKEKASTKSTGKKGSGKGSAKSSKGKKAKDEEAFED
jgi:hypothetical protein